MEKNIKKFIPLISIFAVIITTTLISVWYWQGNATFAMRVFMGVFFLVFGGFKVFNWSGFVKAYKMYDIIAKRSTFYAYLYPVIEISLGVAYLLSFQLFWTNIITVTIMTIGSIGVYLKLKEKEEIPCACLGVVFKIPMTKVTLFEDLLMLVMAIAMLL